jgi:hypothetical protein
MGKAQSDGEKNVLGADLVCEVVFLSFTKEPVKDHLGVLAESATPIPFTKKGVVVSSASVPVGGVINVRLSLLKHRTKRPVFATKEEIKTAKWYHDVGWYWNKFQGALENVPVVGKSLEKVAPDVIQKVRLEYSVAVSKKNSLKYKITLRDTDSIDCPNILMSWEGDFLL